MPAEHIQTGDFLSGLLMAAWLAPLLGFAIEIFAGFWQSDRRSKAAAYLAVGCIGLGFVCSLTALLKYQSYYDKAETAAESKEHADSQGEKHDDGEKQAKAEHGEGHAAHPYRPKAFSGTFYTLAHFGDLKLSIDYYIDSLTLIMFCMVTLIATCIHIFAMGYMSDELTDEYVDHHAHTSDGKHVHRPGRFYQFFSYMSLFCFSMLGLVIAGNIFQVFVFWELVGICSYLLIGFYVERKSASNAANKAFIMNRVGDFGFLIGLMIIWTSFGTFSFGEWQDNDGHSRPGLFEMVRGEHGEMHVAKTDAGEKVVHLNTGAQHPLPEFGAKEGSEESEVKVEEPHESKSIPYWLLITAGLGIFAGCIGKSAQFPLQTWLPDAMEGPTPVSALVHSATMVAAGVYLAGRFFPVFTPEVLLVIAYVGCITLFVAATIAVVATDIKRVLAYSTISQLGYMMLAIGVAGWAAGLFHLITHAFFKSLMFLASGSVIVGCHHEQEMPRMGGLWRKMPITAFTMLVGVVAICGLAIPGAEFWHLGWLLSGALLLWLARVVGQQNKNLGLLVVLVPLAALFADYLWDFEGFFGIAFLWTSLLGVPIALGLLYGNKSTWLPLGGYLLALLLTGVPGAAAFSGFHSKDAIVATSLAFSSLNSGHFLLFIIPLITAGITAFYMFRLWFFTFAGKPRDRELHDHVHETPAVMTVPLIILALFAAGCAIGGEGGFLYQSLLASEPIGLEHGVAATEAGGLALPSHEAIHEVHGTAGAYALIVAGLGTLLAYILYGLGLINPADIKRQFSGVHNFLVEKWQFDRLYDVMFERPVHIVASWCAWVDRKIFDGILHGSARAAVDVSKWDRKFDEGVVDGLVNLVGSVVFGMGSAIRRIQTGRLRQYVMFIAVGVLALFVLLFAFLPKG